jgi:UDP-N-acetylmuramoyl-L-alanyl-D-glutamate--2,6-diaminopimelate ligase
MLNTLRKIIPSSIFSFFQPYYHKFLALLGALLYRFPSRQIIVIGVTGTKGKSTVVELVSKILREAGCKIGSSSSVQFRVGEQIWPNTFKMTMPGRFIIQRYLRMAVDDGCKYFIMEVTSEGIKQYRHWFVDFDVAVFTNIHPEHIEAHGSFENYKKAKGELFKTLDKSRQKSIDGKIIDKIAFVNSDDQESTYFLSLTNAEKITYSLQKLEYTLLKNGSTLTINNVQFTTCLLGKFNIYNALASIKICSALRVDLSVIKQALERITLIPGRMEEISSNQGFKIFVDYAHTPDSLEAVYEFLSKHIVNKDNDQSKKLICVLGATGGGRDKQKRATFGAIASKYCNEIIITNEDPYDEDPNTIMTDVASGVNKEIIPKLILDRREAIALALSLAKNNDVVIITGKGCEPWMMLEDGKKISWDDRQIVREELLKKYSNPTS